MDCSRRCDEDGLDLADLDNADCERQFDDGKRHVWQRLSTSMFKA